MPLTAPWLGWLAAPLAYAAGLAGTDNRPVVDGEDAKRVLGSVGGRRFCRAPNALFASDDRHEVLQYPLAGGSDCGRSLS